MRNLVAVGMAFFVCHPSPAAAQSRLDVVAESRLALSTDASDSPALHGHLSDDQGSPLARRPLTVRVVQNGSGTLMRVRTSAVGDFDLRLPGGVLSVEVTFDGDSQVMPTVAQLARSEFGPRLWIEGPAEVDVSSARSVRVTVRTMSSLPDRVAVQLRDETGRELGPPGVMLSSLSFEIPSRMFGAPGQGELVASGIGLRTASRPVLRYESTRLEWRAHHRTGRQVVLVGRLTSASGRVLAPQWIRVLNGERMVQHQRTNQVGEVRAIVTASDDGAYRLVFGGAEPYLRGGATTTVWSPRPDSASFEWLGLLIPACLAVGAILIKGRRSASSSRGPIANSAALGQRLSLLSRREVKTRFVIRVVDQRTMRPLEAKVDGAEVDHTGEGDSPGTYSFVLDGGDHKVGFTAVGYLPSALSIRSPHYGDWDEFVLEMTSVRDAVHRLLQDLVGAGHDSPKSTRELIDEALAHSPPIELRDLLAEIDRVIYGPTLATEEVFRAIERQIASRRGLPTRVANV